MQAGPEDLAGIIVQRRAQIDDDVRRLSPKCVAVHADAGAGGKFGAHAVIVQHDRVIAGAGGLAGVIEGRAIPGMPDRRVAGIHLHVIARDGHYQHVTEIGMARPGEVRVAEPLDGRVFVAIAGGVSVALADLATGIRVGAELHHAERRRGTGEGMTLSARADERSRRGQGIATGRLSEGCRCDEHTARGEEESAHIPR